VTLSPAGYSKSDLDRLKSADKVNQEREIALGRIIRDGQDRILSLAAGEAEHYPGFKALETLTAQWRFIERTSNVTIEWLLGEILSTTKEYLEQNPASKRAKDLQEEITRLHTEINLASNQLVEANLDLVTRIAGLQKYRQLPYTDRVQEGNLGLMKAVARFNYKMGYRLATFASWWIHKNVAQAVQSQSRTVRLPVSMQKLRGKIFSAFYTLKRRKGDDPSPEEIAEHIGESLPKVLEAMATADESISLETPVGDDGSVLADFIKDENARDPYVSLVEMEMARMARQVLARLTNRERKILTLRYGLEDGEDRSMAEVGRLLALSRERIRQIEKRALERLRLPLIRQGLDSGRVT